MRYRPQLDRLEGRDAPSSVVFGEPTGTGGVPFSFIGDPGKGGPTIPNLTGNNASAAAYDHTGGAVWGAPGVFQAGPP